VKIAEDGEILSRGPHIMKGYWNNEDATRQAIDPDGWFHTGDIGEIDADGFLKITDRKKDIIINAYGKNIAPQPLEALLKSSPYIGTPVLIGDRRKFLVALLVPNFDKLERDAKAMGVDTRSRDELIANERVRQSTRPSSIDSIRTSTVRRKSAALPCCRAIHHRRRRDHSVAQVKRKMIDKKYKEIIDQLYIDEKHRCMNGC